MNLQNRADERFSHIIRSSKLSEELNNLLEEPSLNTRSIVPAEGIGDTINPTRIKELLENPNSFDLQRSEDVVIDSHLRPVLEIKNNNINVNEVKLNYWKNILEPLKDNLPSVIQSIGRIGLKREVNLFSPATGWLISDDIIITNRHVAEFFAYQKGTEFIFKQDFFDNDYEVCIDFLKEIDRKEKSEFEISEILYIEPKNSFDIAFLRIKWNNNNSTFKPLVLSDNIEQDQTVATIGYPGRNHYTKIREAQIKIFGNIFNVKRLALGEIDSVDLKNGLLLHDCSTLVGNSGSPIIDLESGKVLGLHFSGRELISNFAITANILKDRLNLITKKRRSYVKNFI